MSKSRKGRKNRNINNNDNSSANQLFNMLNNIDPNQISNLLSSMGLDNNMGNNQEVYKNNNAYNASSSVSEQDKTLQVLKILQSMTNANESEIIDKMIKIYTITRILNK